MEVESLYAAVFERPSDDGPRHVLADALMEAGDPRGEFVSLQLQTRRNERSERRMQKLLERHRAGFLRGLAPLVMPGESLRWERGFPDEATVLLEGLHVDLPDLATLRKVEVVFSPAAPLELASVHMKSLVEVTSAGLSAVPVLFSAARRLNVESVGLSGPGDLSSWPLEVITAISSSDSLPRLSRLHLATNRPQFDDAHWVWKLEVLSRLKTLEFDGTFRGLPLRELLETMRRVKVMPQHLAFHAVGLTLRLRRDDGFRSVHIEVEPPTGVVVLCSMLDTLSPDALDDLSIHAARPLTPALAGSLRLAAKRLHLTNLSLPGDAHSARR